MPIIIFDLASDAVDSASLFLAAIDEAASRIGMNLDTQIPILQPHLLCDQMVSTSHTVRSIISQIRCEVKMPIIFRCERAFTELLYGLIVSIEDDLDRKDIFDLVRLGKLTPYELMRCCSWRTWIRLTIDDDKTSFEFIRNASIVLDIAENGDLKVSYVNCSPEHRFSLPITGQGPFDSILADQYSTLANYEAELRRLWSRDNINLICISAAALSDVKVQSIQSFVNMVGEMSRVKKVIIDLDTCRIRYA